MLGLKSQLNSLASIKHWIAPAISSAILLVSFQQSSSKSLENDVFFCAFALVGWRHDFDERLNFNFSIPNY